ncbi:hypothetical protein MRX96_037363 [Rhipicephalus microplus]
MAAVATHLGAPHKSITGTRRAAASPLTSIPRSPVPCALSAGAGRNAISPGRPAARPDSTVALGVSGILLLAAYVDPTERERYDPEEERTARGAPRRPPW